MTSMKHTPTPYSYSITVDAGDFVLLGLHRGFGDTFSEQLHFPVRMTATTEFIDADCLLMIDEIAYRGA